MGVNFLFSHRPLSLVCKGPEPEIEDNHWLAGFVEDLVSYFNQNSLIFLTVFELVYRIGQGMNGKIIVNSAVNAVFADGIGPLVSHDNVTTRTGFPYHRPFLMLTKGR